MTKGQQQLHPKLQKVALIQPLASTDRVTNRAIDRVGVAHLTLASIAGSKPSG